MVSTKSVSGWNLLATKPHFRKLIFSSVLWYSTRSYEQIVLSWLVLQITDSVSAVAALSAARGLPMLLLAYVGGSLSDRAVSLRILRITQSLSLVFVSMYTLYLLLFNPIPWTAHVVIGLSGIVWSFDFSNRRSLYKEILESKDLATAVPVDTIIFTIGLIVGPIIAGIATRIAGFGVAYLVLAVIHAASLILLPVARHEQVVKVNNPKNTSIREMFQGLLTVLRSQRVLQAIVAVTLVANFFAFPFHQMVPVISRDVLSADALHFGILAAAWGVGALAGSLVLTTRPSRRPGWTFAAGMTTLFICVCGFALSRNYLLSLGFLLTGGIGFAGFASMQIFITLSTASPTFHGRSLGVVGLAIGMQPLGAISLGLLAERTGPRIALASFTLVGLCALLIVRWRYPELGRRAVFRESTALKAAPPH